MSPSSKPRRPTDESKICRACGEKKPTSEFWTKLGKPEARCIVCMKAAKAREYQVRKAEYAVINRAQYLAHRDERLAKVSARYWKKRAEIQEYMRGYLHEHYSANKQTYITKSKKRSALKRSRGSYTREELLRVLSAQRFRCYYCATPIGPERSQHSPDHKTPLARGGSNTIDNICCTCQPCNKSKGAKTESEFLVFMREHPKVFAKRKKA